jgi:hypothetical protein
MKRQILALVWMGILCQIRAEDPSEVRYPPADVCDRTTSPKGTFFIESYGSRSDLQWLVWRTGNQVKSVQLPTLKHSTDGAIPGGFRYEISSDEEWIYVTSKLWRGANASWLLHRKKPMQYSLVTPCFSEAAWKYYNAVHGADFRLDETFIIRKGPWPKAGNQLRFTLWGGPGVDCAFCYDLSSRKFLRSRDQTTSYVDLRLDEIEELVPPLAPASQ